MRLYAVLAGTRPSATPLKKSLCLCPEIAATFMIKMRLFNMIRRNAAAVFVLLCVCAELVSTNTNHCAHIARSCASRYCVVIMRYLARHQSDLDYLLQEAVDFIGKIRIPRAG